MELDKDFSEFLALLNEHRVEYLVVGGYAVAVHGHPRYTGDLDVWVDPTKANAEKLRLVIDAFGFDIAPLADMDFERETIAFHLGTPPIRSKWNPRQLHQFSRLDQKQESEWSGEGFE